MLALMIGLASRSVYQLLRLNRSLGEELEHTYIVPSVPLITQIDVDGNLLPLAAHTRAVINDVSLFAETGWSLGKLFLL